MPGLAPGAAEKLEAAAGLVPGKPDGVGGLEKEPGELKPAQELGLLAVAAAPAPPGPAVPLLKFGLGQEPGRAI